MPVKVQTPSSMGIDPIKNLEGVGLSSGDNIADYAVVVCSVDDPTASSYRSASMIIWPSSKIVIALSSGSAKSISKGSLTVTSGKRSIEYDAEAQTIVSSATNFITITGYK